MSKTHSNSVWLELQNDPDNWVRIPEFGVMPMDVSFEGFSIPIRGPRKDLLLWASDLRDAVRAIRQEARRRFASLRELKACYEGAIDNLPEDLDASIPLPWDSQQAFAFHFESFMWNVERVVLNYRHDKAGSVEHLAAALATSFLLRDVPAVSASAVLRAENVRRARAAADARHSRPGGARDRAEAIRAAWASGKYSSRDICADEEYEALGFGSFAAARKALRNTPDPT